MPVAPPAEDRTRRGPDRRILAAGVLLAAAAGAWVGQRLQEPSRVQATEVTTPHRLAHRAGHRGDDEPG